MDAKAACLLKGRIQEEWRLKDLCSDLCCDLLRVDPGGTSSAEAWRERLGMVGFPLCNTSCATLGNYGATYSRLRDMNLSCSEDSQLEAWGSGTY